MPPGFVEYVMTERRQKCWWQAGMTTSEKAGAGGTPRGAGQSCVSTGGWGWKGARVGTAADAGRGPFRFPGPLYGSHSQLQQLHRVGPGIYPWSGCQTAWGPKLAQPLRQLSRWMGPSPSQGFI